jgi:hypothetical protein
MDARSVFKATAVTGTNTYRSKVTELGGGKGYSFTVQLTSTATGTLSVWINNLEKVDYEAAVAAAAGSTRVDKEAANTTGWRQMDLRCGGRNPHMAAATQAMDGAGATATQVVSFPEGPARVRLQYVNATNSGALNAERNEA